MNSRWRWSTVRTSVLFALLAAAPFAAAASVLTVLPLGDSITDGGLGYGIGAYRNQLWKDFNSDLNRVDFLGSQNSGPPELGDKDHEGHRGWPTPWINTCLDGDDSSFGGSNGGHWLTGIGSRPAIYPDVILLHTGTNDVMGGTAIWATNNLDTLLGHIFTLRPSTKLVVASVIPRTDNSSYEAVSQAYNAMIPGLVTKYRTLGDQIFFVDMHSVLTGADLSSDGIHPLAEGYDKMGDAWYGALAQAGIVTPEPGPLVLLTTGTVAAATFACRRKWKRRMKPLSTSALVLTLAMSIASPASATVIWTGAVDPTTAGFTFIGNTPFAINSDNNGPQPGIAYQNTTASLDQVGQYDMRSSSLGELMNANGWTMETKLQSLAVVNPPNSPMYGLGLALGITDDTGSGAGLFFDPGEDAIVITTSDGTKVAATVVGLSNAYHTVKVVVAKGASTAQVFVDGASEADVTRGSGARKLWFGDGTSTGGGAANWAYVKMNVPLPEPCTSTLLLTGVLGLVVYAWRKRN